MDRSVLLENQPHPQTFQLPSMFKPKQHQCIRNNFVKMLDKRCTLCKLLWFLTAPAWVKNAGLDSYQQGK
eukprot:5518983-Amphidinium_carterae.1